MNRVQIFLTVLTSVVVPIVVALISSGTIAKFTTKRMNLNELNANITTLSDKIDKIDYKVDKNEADTYRTRILRFNGEIKRGVKHDEEEFNDCLLCIDKYEDFCQAHPEYPNNKCLIAIENVERVYRECLESNSF